MSPFPTTCTETEAASSLTFSTSMTKGRKEEVVSSVIRRRGGDCWCSFGRLPSSPSTFLFSSPTKYLCKTLYGALKFLMKASETNTDTHHENRVTIRIMCSTLTYCVCCNDCEQIIMGCLLGHVALGKETVLKHEN